MTAEEKYILQWMRFEKKDADFIAIISTNETYVANFKSHIVFLCQQSIEKYLKTCLLFYKISFPKTHQLEKLQELLNKSGDKNFDKLDFRNLSAYAVDSRYPDEYEDPPLDELNYYISLVTEIKSLVESKIKFQAL